MSKELEANRCVPNATYQIENRQFVVKRIFSDEKTIPEILTAELTNGFLQQQN